MALGMLDISPDGPVPPGVTPDGHDLRPSSRLTPAEADVALAEYAKKWAELPARTAHIQPEVTHTDSQIADAVRQREALKASPDFQKRFLAGNAAAVKQMTALNEIIASADNTTLALLGYVPPGHADTGTEVGLRDTISAVEGMRAEGLSDDVIRQAIEMPPVSKQERQFAETRKAEMLSNSEWMRRFREGDVVTKREMRLINIILASPVRS